MTGIRSLSRAAHVAAYVDHCASDAGNGHSRIQRAIHDVSLGDGVEIKAHRFRPRDDACGRIEPDRRRCNRAREHRCIGAFRRNRLPPALQQKTHAPAEGAAARLAPMFRCANDAEEIGRRLELLGPVQAGNLALQVAPVEHSIETINFRPRCARRRISLRLTGCAHGHVETRAQHTRIMEDEQFASFTRHRRLCRRFDRRQRRETVGRQHRVYRLAPSNFWITRASRSMSGTQRRFTATICLPSGATPPPCVATPQLAQK